MQAYFSKLKIKETEHLMYRMIKMKLFPTYVTYTGLIHSHACVGRLDVALIYLPRLTTNGYVPDLRIFNVIPVCTFDIFYPKRILIIH